MVGKKPYRQSVMYPAVRLPGSETNAKSFINNSLPSLTCLFVPQSINRNPHIQRWNQTLHSLIIGTVQRTRNCKQIQILAVWEYISFLSTEHFQEGCYQMTQVLVAFVATAHKIWLCCIAKNRIDHLRSSGKSTPSHDKESFSLGTVITSFSDQHIVTGISAIVPGFLSLAQVSTLYHWLTVANLAWFSAFTHVTILAALRGEDRFNKTIPEAPHTCHGNSGHNADLCTFSPVDK